VAYDYHQFTNDVLDDAHCLELKFFKSSVFKRINRLLSIDCGRWLTRTSVAEDYHASGMYLYNLPEDRDRVVRPRFQNRDFLYNAIVENMGAAVNAESLMNDEQWFSSEVYVDMCKDYGIDRAVSIIVPCEYTGVYNGIGFYRTGKENRFSEEERQQIEHLAHFISRVLRLCLFRNLQQANNEGVNEGAEAGNCAIFDHLGRLVDSTPLFKSCVSSLLNQEFSSLPSSWFSPEQLPNTFVLESARFHITHLQDLYLVMLQTKTIFDDFTERQKLVAEYMAQGASNADIAEGLSISVHTASEHARNIQEKCGIFGKGSNARTKTALFLSGQPRA